MLALHVNEDAFLNLFSSFFQREGHDSHVCFDYSIPHAQNLACSYIIASAQALGKIDTTGIATRGIISQHK